jgi:hypothetical protein
MMSGEYISSKGLFSGRANLPLLLDEPKLPAKSMREWSHKKNPVSPPKRGDRMAIDDL